MAIVFTGLSREKAWCNRRNGVRADGEVSNPYFALRIDPLTGSISKLVDRRSGKELLHPDRYGGNELVLEEEKIRIWKG